MVVLGDINKYLVSLYTSHTFVNYMIIMFTPSPSEPSSFQNLPKMQFIRAIFSSGTTLGSKKKYFFTMLHPTTMHYFNLLAAAIFVIRYGQASHPCSYPSNKLHWQWTWSQNIWRIVNSVPGPNSLWGHKLIVNDIGALNWEYQNHSEILKNIQGLKREYQNHLAELLF